MSQGPGIMAPPQVEGRVWIPRKGFLIQIDDFSKDSLLRSHSPPDQL